MVFLPLSLPFFFLELIQQIENPFREGGVDENVVMRFERPPDRRPEPSDPARPSSAMCRWLVLIFPFAQPPAVLVK